jgi:hypothetical protein
VPVVAAADSTQHKTPWRVSKCSEGRTNDSVRLNKCQRAPRRLDNYHRVLKRIKHMFAVNTDTRPIGTIFCELKSSRALRVKSMILSVAQRTNKRMKKVKVCDHLQACGAHPVGHIRRLPVAWAVIGKQSSFTRGAHRHVASA